MNLERFASRKFLLALLTLLLGTAFFALGKLTADQWSSLISWVLGLYMAGNVGDTAATGVKEKS